MASCFSENHAHREIRDQWTAVELGNSGREFVDSRIIVVDHDRWMQVMSDVTRFTSVRLWPDDDCVARAKSVRGRLGVAERSSPA
jgi:hypothetical protein